MNTEILREIKASFRRAMNADLSNSMRSGGLIYKMNFGVPSPRIKLISQDFPVDEELADYLWNEDVRESKMLATYLFPVEKMDFKKAVEWAEQIKYTEIADQAAKNLFIRLPFQEELAGELISSDMDIMHYTGYRLLVNMLMHDISISPEFKEFLLPQIKNDLKKNIVYLYTVILNLMERSFDSGVLTIGDIKEWETDEDINIRNAYDYLTD